MSSTPLLAGAGALPGPHMMQDHVSARPACASGLAWLTRRVQQPVFLRASHSPWGCIPQNVLVVIRGIILGYLTATSALIAHYKLTEESDKPLAHHLFDFSLISLALVLVYHLITFVSSLQRAINLAISADVSLCSQSWTFTHLYYPDPDDNEGGIESWIIKAMSLPGNMASLRRQFYFTMFYSTTTVFAFMNLAIYWFITRQHGAADGGDAMSVAAAGTGTDVLTTSVLTANASTMAPIPDAPFSDLFGEGWLKVWVFFNLYGATSVIMVLEILLCNSIKMPLALVSHFLGLLFNSGLYLAWAALGKAVTGTSPFFWLDEAEVGSKEAVTAYCIGFALLSQIMYTLMLGFVGIRQGVTKSRGGGGAQETLDS
ncbi:Uncharacterized protein TCAP_01969 [Tolypocladium capitatum]|uniref:Uncharacterized protein n=1 Tax=Tolypocladium capitatum TaxID=45235 RepID=A0A2K3QKP2_9HYPO|nr:Uncharacterized protein TCAP_01969 [Tolypocladium capitatum]